MKLFIADDSELIRHRLTDELSRIAGVAVIGHAATVPLAIDSIRRCQPDLVVLDISMPGGSGLEVLDIVKRELPETVVIVCTQYLEAPFREHSLKRGADFFVPKTTQFSELLAIIEQQACQRRK